jgi:predicted nucleotidyltransferase
LAQWCRNQYPARRFDAAKREPSGLCMARRLTKQGRRGPPTFLNRYVSETASLWFKKSMNREVAIAEMAARADALKARGIAAAYLFGSTVRGEQSQDSDLDIFIDITPGRKFSLIDLCGVQNLLERELGVEVDLLTRRALLPDLRPDIERDAIRIF